MQKLHFLLVMWDGGGTLPPELTIARKLIQQGHSVSVLGEDSMEQEVLAARCHFFRYQHAPNRIDRSPSANPFPDWDGGSPFKILKKLLFESASAYAQDVYEACQHQSFDRILVDGFLIGGLVGAEAAEVPHFAIWPALDLIPHPGRPPDGLGFLPSKNIFKKYRNQLLNSVFIKVLKSGRKQINQARNNYGLVPLLHPFDQYHQAEEVWLLSSVHFDYPIHPPKNLRYIGPQLDDPSWATARDLSHQKKEKTRILVSLGSTYQAQKEVYQNIITALGELAVEGIVTLGNVYPSSAFECTSNVAIYDNASHHVILPTCDLVINHGGHGTVMKSIMAGLPQLVIPFGRDQFGNAARVTYGQMGHRLSKNASPKRIKAKIVELLEDRAFTENTIKLAKKIKEEIDQEKWKSFLY